MLNTIFINMHSHEDILLTTLTAYLNSCTLTKKQHHWMQSHEKVDCWKTLLFTKTAGTMLQNFLMSNPKQLQYKLWNSTPTYASYNLHRWTWSKVSFAHGKLNLTIATKSWHHITYQFDWFKKKWFKFIKVLDKGITTRVLINLQICIYSVLRKKASYLDVYQERQTS